MTLVDLHYHFKMHGVEFLSLDTKRNYLHCIYQNTDNGLKFTIPKIEPGRIKSEVVVTACQYLRIPVPEMNYSK